MSKPHKISTKAKLRYNYYRIRLEASKFWDKFRPNEPNDKKFSQQSNNQNSEEEDDDHQSSVHDEDTFANLNVSDFDSNDDDETVHYDATAKSSVKDTKSKTKFSFLLKLLDSSLTSSNFTSKQSPSSSKCIQTQITDVTQTETLQTFKRYNDTTSTMIQRNNYYRNTECIGNNSNTKFGTFYIPCVEPSQELRPLSARTISSDESGIRRSIMDNDQNNQSRRRKRSSRTTSRRENEYNEIGPFSSPITEGDQNQSERFLNGSQSQKQNKQEEEHVEKMLLEIPEVIEEPERKQRTAESISKKPNSLNIPSSSKSPKISVEKLPSTHETPSLHSSKNIPIEIPPTIPVIKDPEIKSPKALSFVEEKSKAISLVEEKSKSISIKSSPEPVSILREPAVPAIPKTIPRPKLNEKRATLSFSPLKDWFISVTNRRRDPSAYEKRPREFHFGMKFVYRAEPIRQRDIERERKRQEEEKAGKFVEYDYEDDNDLVSTLAKLILPRSCMPEDDKSDIINSKKPGKKKATRKNSPQTNALNAVVASVPPVQQNNQNRINILNPNDRYSIIRQNHQISQRFQPYSTLWGPERNKPFISVPISIIREPFGKVESLKTNLDLQPKKFYSSEIKTEDKDEIKILDENNNVETDLTDMHYKPKSTFTSQFSSLLKKENV